MCGDNGRSRTVECGEELPIQAFCQRGATFQGRPGTKERCRQPPPILPIDTIFCPQFTNYMCVSTYISTRPGYHIFHQSNDWNLEAGIPDDYQSNIQRAVRNLCVGGRVVKDQIFCKPLIHGQTARILSKNMLASLKMC